MRRSYQGTCATCGAEFITGHPYTIYCSPECRQEAASQRMRSRRPLPPARPQRQAVQIDALGPVAGGLEVRAWQGTPIHRRSTDGWVNATAMCQAGGKRWNHYAANDRTREYIAALRASVVTEKPCSAVVAGNPATLPEVVEVRQGGAAHLQGTWVHPRLAVDLARWISPAFAVWMDGWFLETITRGATPPHHQPTTPGITVTARTEREAMQLWLSALEAETIGALRMVRGTTGRTDSGLRPHGPWRFMPC